MRNLIAATWACIALAVSQLSAKTPVLIDTDIGAAIDDAFALALAVASPELEIVGVTTVGEPRDDRTWIARRFLSQVGKPDVPVAAGSEPQPSIPVDWQIQYRRHPAAVFDRAGKLAKQTTVELMADAADKHDGKLTLLCLGPLTNAARLLSDKPQAASKLHRIVLMGGSLAPSEPEWNIKTDVAAAQAVFRSGLPLVVVPLDATSKLTLTKDLRDRLFSAHTQLTHQGKNLYELSEEDAPVLFDVGAVAAAFDAPHSSKKQMRLEVDDTGRTVVADGAPNATVVTSIETDRFLAWFVDRVRSFGEQSLPRPAGNGSTLVDAGAFPSRVHVIEDFETDIEKRWWMSGKLETRDVPTPGGRACRAVLTQDFDDLQGDTETMYRAVVFNPVPGPPMGANTRLSFRYKLHGVDTLRVQLYSLTNGYHRCLSLFGLPQDEWKQAAVDLTQMGRPDRSGGALQAGERIDDIQFYIDPRGELLIDDIVLYDYGSPKEKRWFPERMVFTAWFDTGKQGAEWPGEFEIVNEEKGYERFAQSVPDRRQQKNQIRLSLRGLRRLDPTTEISFQHNLTGAKSIEIALFRTDIAKPIASQSLAIETDDWRESTAHFDLGELREIDEVRFTLPAEATLQIDNVLIYTPSG